MHYWLPRNVYLYLDRDSAIWLDIRADRYVGQKRSELEGLQSIVHDWPKDRDIASTPSPDALEIGAQLEQMGLLTRENTGRGARNAFIPRAESSFIEETDRALPNPRHLILIIYCYARVKLAWRNSLEKAMSRVMRHSASTTDRWTSSDAALARKLTGAFLRLRPYIYGSRRNCLLDSMVLIEFLAHFKLHANLVIAIQTAPFAAHSWAQNDCFALNEEVACTRMFAPILVI